MAIDAIEAEGLLANQRVVVASEDVAIRTKTLLAECLKNDIPAMIGPCGHGG